MQAHDAQPAQAANAVTAIAAVAVPPQPAHHPPTAHGDANGAPTLSRQHSYLSPPADSPLRVKPRVIDPYEPQPDFPLPLLGQILLFLLDIVLVPLRIISALLILTLLWAACKVLTIGVQPAVRAGEPGFGPLRTWLIRWVVRSLGQPFCWCFGIITARVAHVAANTTRGVLISNHWGYIEIMVLIAQYAPSVVAKAEVASYPLIGTIARALQCIFVERKNPESRVRARDLMIERARAAEGLFPPLLLFPEGTTANGAALLKMQKGIFAAGVPVQPLALRAHFCYFNSTWVRGSMGGHVLRLLSRLYHSVSMTELALYVPTSAEVADPALFADNVATTVANALGQVVTQKTVYDNPELAATVKKRRQLRKEEKQAKEAEAAAAAAAAGRGQTSQTRPLFGMTTTRGEGGDAAEAPTTTSPQQPPPSVPEVRIDVRALSTRAESNANASAHPIAGTSTNVAPPPAESPSARRHARAWGSGTQQMQHPPSPAPGHKLAPRSSNSRTRPHAQPHTQAHAHGHGHGHAHGHGHGHPHGHVQEHGHDRVLSAEVHPFPGANHSLDSKREPSLLRVSHT